MTAEAIMSPGGLSQHSHVTTHSSLLSAFLNTHLHRHNKKQKVLDEARMLSEKAVSNLFPFHVFFDEELTIESVGKDLPAILGSTADDLIGEDVDEVFAFVKPRKNDWSEEALFAMEHEPIAVEPLFPSLAVSCRLVLTGSLVVTSRKRGECLLILTPDNESLEQLNLAAPRYGLVGQTEKKVEHRKDQMVADGLKAQMVTDSLRASLHKEQQLVESLLPKHAAEGLRRGQHVDPIFHQNVSMFFSDIAGFTKMVRTTATFEH